jgi:hypothetical protein
VARTGQGGGLFASNKQTNIIFTYYIKMLNYCIFAAEPPDGGDIAANKVALLQLLIDSQ